MMILGFSWCCHRPLDSALRCSCPVPCIRSLCIDTHSESLGISHRLKAVQAAHLLLDKRNKRMERSSFCNYMLTKHSVLCGTRDFILTIALNNCHHSSRIFDRFQDVRSGPSSCHLSTSLRHPVHPRPPRRSFSATLPLCRTRILRTRSLLMTMMLFQTVYLYLHRQQPRPQRYPSHPHLRQLPSASQVCPLVPSSSILMRYLGSELSALPFHPCRQPKGTTSTFRSKPHRSHHI